MKLKKVAIRGTMNELVYLNNDEALTDSLMMQQKKVIRGIGLAIKKENYDIACDFLIGLNEWRASNKLKTYSISDILFMNFDVFGENGNSTEKKCIYVIHFDDESIKIGISKNPEERINTLSNISGKKVIEFWHSNLLENAFEIEQKLHNYFSENRIKGEYFKIDYEKAVMQAKEIALLT